jgi:hypothetical protein
MTGFALVTARRDAIFPQRFPPPRLRPMRPALAIAAALALVLSCAPAVAPAAEEALRAHGGPVAR